MIGIDRESLWLLAAFLLPISVVFAAALVALLEQISVLEQKLSQKQKIGLDQAELTGLVARKLEEEGEKYVQKFSAVSRQELALFTQKLALGGQESLSLLGEYEKGLVKTTGKELEDLKGVLRQELKEAYNQMLREVAQEKKRKLADLEKELPLLVEKVVEEVLGRSIRDKEHEELVFQALEKAKRQGGLK
jgi:flagellar biosynthesis/type III secretory pathway protein FliH